MSLTNDCWEINLPRVGEVIWGEIGAKERKWGWGGSVGRRTGMREGGHRDWSHLELGLGGCQIPVLFSKGARKREKTKDSCLLWGGGH